MAIAQPAGEFGPPYRPPCAGDGSHTWPSAPAYQYYPWQNYDATHENGLTKHANITQWQKLVSGVWTAQGQPAARLACAVPDCTSGLSTTNPPPCGPWGISERLLTGGTPQEANEFVATEEHVNQAVCQKLGFKAVQAKKRWHGAFRFLAHDPVGRPSRMGLWNCPTGSASTCCPTGTQLEDIQDTPEDTKYCSLEVTADKSAVQILIPSDISTGTPPSAWTTTVTTSSASSTITLDPGTGTFVRGCSGAPAGGGTVDVSNAAWVALPTATTYFSPQSAITIYNQAFPPGGSTYTTCTDCAAGGCSGADGTYCVTEATTDNQTFTVKVYTWISGVKHQTAYATLNVETGAVECTTYGWTDFTHTQWAVTNAQKLAYTDTGDGVGVVFTYESITGVYQSGSYWLGGKTTYTGTLGTPYTEATALATCETLASWWPLNDDPLYPWRKDAHVTVAPLVTVNEAPVAVNLLSIGLTGGTINCNVFQRNYVYNEGTGVWDDTGPNPDYYDHTSTLYETTFGGASVTYDSGTVGAPLPFAVGASAQTINGSSVLTKSGYFDWDHVTWGCCIVPETGTHTWYPLYYGQWSQDAEGIPLRATQWTNNYDASHYFPGAWKFFDTASGAVVLQKWAETRVPRPSYNFARPCGADRWDMDETTALCVTSVTGTGPLTVSFASGPTGFVAGDFVIYACSTPGLYQVAATDSTAHTAELTLVTAIPPIQMSYADNVVGKARWYDKPGICGRTKIVAAVNSAYGVDLTLALPSYLTTTDTVYVSGLSGVGTGAVAVTQVSSTDAAKVSIAGTLSAPYVAGGYIAATGDPTVDATFQWNDNQWKGEYLCLEWLQNLRDYQEVDRIKYDWDHHNVLYSNCNYFNHNSHTPIRPIQDENGMPRRVDIMNVTEACSTWPAPAVTVPYTTPMVFAISPNGETWDHGVTYDFNAGAGAADARYGALWQSAIMQHMEDLLWQAPHAVCEGSPNAPTPCNWKQDDGSGVADACSGGVGARYYPHSPWVEARRSVPSGAPALPAGVLINIIYDSVPGHMATVLNSTSGATTFVGGEAPTGPGVDLAAYNAAQPENVSQFLTQGGEVKDPSVEGLVIPPPEMVGAHCGNPITVNDPETPWKLLLDETQNVCTFPTPGRFADVYKANGAVWC